MTDKRKWQNCKWILEHNWIPPSQKKAVVSVLEKADFLEAENTQSEWKGSDIHIEQLAWVFSETTFQKLIEMHIPFALEVVFMKQKDSSQFKFWRDFRPLRLDKTLLFQNMREISLLHWETAIGELKTLSQEQRYLSIV